MATKRQKKDEAKRQIDLLPDVPPLPIPLFRAARPAVRAAKGLAKGLVEADPLGIITDDEVMMAMVNDPSFKLSANMIDLINDDDRMLVSNGNGLMEINGRDVIRRSGQFSRMALSPRSLGSPKKSGRKKTKTDKMMSKALAQANKELRKKNGMLRKGVSQADIMRRAHRIRQKLS